LLSIAIFEVYNNYLDNVVTIVFEVDDNVNYIELHINNAYRLVETIIIIIIIDRDVDVKREDKERTIINTLNRQRCWLYIELENIKNVVDKAIHN